MAKGHASQPNDANGWWRSRTARATSSAQRTGSSTSDGHAASFHVPRCRYGERQREGAEERDVRVQALRGREEVLELLVHAQDEPEQRPHEEQRGEQVQRRARRRAATAAPDARRAPPRRSATRRGRRRSAIGHSTGMRGIASTNAAAGDQLQRQAEELRQAAAPAARPSTAPPRPRPPTRPRSSARRTRAGSRWSRTRRPARGTTAPAGATARGRARGGSAASDEVERGQRQRREREPVLEVLHERPPASRSPRAARRRRGCRRPRGRPCWARRGARRGPPPRRTSGRRRSGTARPSRSARAGSSARPTRGRSRT